MTKPAARAGVDDAGTDRHGTNLYVRFTVQQVNMNELSDERIRLRAEESSVLVHELPFTVPPPRSTQPPVSATVASSGSTSASAGFPSQTDLAAEGDTVLVAPAEEGAFGDVPVYTVASPDDLTGYGVALTQVLEDYDVPLYVDVDSLTALLQHVSVDTAFRFVHVLSGRVDREQAVLVASIDPGAHDEQTVATMTQPFDVTVTGDEDNRRVRRRG
ncbi:DUF7504 family protein [Salinigranum sp. GCM10025319]|uniref:DUF7504 family protein n=1 Tax=Salinigranum sp. GCM10025319 TaxID=3252687 RepID=UPI0036194C69